jgi:hypothetical protein
VRKKSIFPFEFWDSKICWNDHRLLNSDVTFRVDTFSYKKLFNPTSVCPHLILAFHSISSCPTTHLTGYMTIYGNRRRKKCMECVKLRGPVTYSSATSCGSSFPPSWSIPPAPTDLRHTLLQSPNRIEETKANQQRSRRRRRHRCCPRPARSGACLRRPCRRCSPAPPHATPAAPRWSPQPSAPGPTPTPTLTPSGPTSCPAPSRRSPTGLEIPYYNLSDSNSNKILQRPARLISRYPAGQSTRTSIHHAAATPARRETWWRLWWSRGRLSRQ